MKEKAKKEEKDGVPANNLKRVRESRGLTVAQLSTLTGIPGPSLTRFENHDRAMSTVHIAKLIQSLRISFTELLDTSARGILLQVTGQVTEGIFKENPYFDGDPSQSVYIPEIEGVDPRELIAVVVEGESTHSKYAQGTVLVVKKLTKLQLKNGILAAGKRYLVEKIDDEGRVELTVRRLDFDASGKAWLSFEVPEAWRQHPVTYNVGNPSMQVVGVVVKAITDE